MSERTSANRYAKALLEVALQEADAERVGEELDALAAAMRGSAELRRALTNPGIAVPIRAKVAKAVAEKLAVQPPVAKLVALLAERGRVDLLPTLAEVYRERLRAHRNIVRATVTSAVPLSAEKLDQLRASLASVTGKSVELETTVDPSIVGGVVTRIGSTVYDGSIRTQLAKIRERLVESA